MEINDILHYLFSESSLWRMIVAAICGAGVGMIYFESLRWSIKKLNTSKHRISMFASVAICRIALFFGVLILVGHRQISLILIYLVAFFLMKILVIWVEKRRIIHDVSRSGEKNER